MGEKIEILLLPKQIGAKMIGHNKNDESTVVSATIFFNFSSHMLFISEVSV